MEEYSAVPTLSGRSDSGQFGKTEDRRRSGWPAVDVELFPDLGGDLFPVHGAAADLQHDLRFVSQTARPGGEMFIQESKLAEA